MQLFNPPYDLWLTIIQKKDLHSGAREAITWGLLCCPAPTQRREDRSHRWETGPKEERGEGLVL